MFRKLNRLKGKSKFFFFFFKKEGLLFYAFQSGKALMMDGNYSNIWADTWKNWGNKPYRYVGEENSRKRLMCSKSLRQESSMFKKWQRSSVEDGQSEKKSEWKSMS